MWSEKNGGGNRFLINKEESRNCLDKWKKYINSDYWKAGDI